MKREPSLISYSHEHHEALSAARRLSRQSGGSASVRLAAAADFLAFFNVHVVDHMDREEAELFPLSIAHGDPDLVRHVEVALADHRELRTRTAALGEEVRHERALASIELREIGELLTNHVRFEERVLFQEIQRAGTLPPMDDDAPRCDA